MASSVNEMQKLLDLSKLGKKEEKQIRLQEHIAEQDEIAAMHTELPILQSALDSLFASSIDFPVYIYIYIIYIGCKSERANPWTGAFNTSNDGGYERTRIGSKEGFRPTKYVWGN